MKISNSKKELARIISENDGWREGAEFAVQGQETKLVGFSKSMPYRRGCGWFIKGEMPVADFKAGHVITNWHQTILSRAEYFHLCPAPDADGWIEWEGGMFAPVIGSEVIDVMYANGAIAFEVNCDSVVWEHQKTPRDYTRVAAYRLRKPEQSNPEFCESVMRSIPEPEAKPTIEQLAADYRNAKDYADRKQQEADDAKTDAEAKLAELIASGKALGLVLSAAEKVAELVITDFLDLQLNDIIEYVDGSIKDKIGMTGPVVEFAPDATDGMRVRMKCDNGPNKGRLGWPMKWRFIRRP